MREWGELTGRALRPGRPGYRTDDAEQIVVAMGTIADTATAVVDHLRAAGRRVGSVTVTAFRPFPAGEVATAWCGTPRRSPSSSAPTSLRRTTTR